MATIDETHDSAGEVLARVEAEGVEFVRFWFTDILGQIKSFAVGAEELPGAIEESDMVAMPDPSTFKLLPWRKENPVGRMFCDVLTPSREPYEGDPRYVMK